MIGLSDRKLYPCLAQNNPTSSFWNRSTIHLFISKYNDSSSSRRTLQLQDISQFANLRRFHRSRAVLTKSYYPILRRYRKSSIHQRDKQPIRKLISTNKCSSYTTFTLIIAAVTRPFEFLQNCSPSMAGQSLPLIMCSPLFTELTMHCQFRADPLASIHIVNSLTFFFVTISIPLCCHTYQEISILSAGGSPIDI